MYTVLIVLHVLLAASLIAIVLVQRGPGATMGAAFGAGASGTVFGSRGAAGFLTKLTSWLGVGFFAVSLTMAVLVARSGNVAETADDLGVAGQLSEPAPEQPAGETGDESFPEVPTDEPASASEAGDESEEEFPEPPIEGGEDDTEPEDPPAAP